MTMTDDHTQRAMAVLLAVAEDKDSLPTERMNAANSIITHYQNQERLTHLATDVNGTWNINDRGMKLDESKFTADGAGAEIDRLAHFLTENYPREIQGTAVDTVIRMLSDEDDDA
jgi:hypothetical protein